MDTVFTGTWEEIVARSDELRGKRLRVEVLQEPYVGVGENFDPKKFEQVVERLRALSAGHGPLPARTFTLEDFYPDED